jgi:ABC-type multidrug transport system fused ATPase/permease subunit
MQTSGLNSLLLILIAGLLVESIVDTFKTLYDCKKDFKCYTTKIMSMIVGIVVAFVYNLDLPAFLGFSALIYGFTSNLLTGLLISRGSNFLHDLFDKISKLKAPAQLVGTIIPANTTATTIESAVEKGTTTLNIVQKHEEEQQ